MTTSVVSSPSAIEPTHLYPITVAQRICRWEKHAWRQRLREGLKVRYLGGKGFVLGSDLIEHIILHGRSQRLS